MKSLSRATPLICALIAGCSADAASSTEPATPTAAITEPLHGHAAEEVNAKARIVAEIMSRGERVNLPRNQTIEPADSPTDPQSYAVERQFAKRKYSPEVAAAIRTFQEQHEESAQ